MKLAIIGTGYVGLVTGTCLAELGHSVTCCDLNTQKILALQNFHMPIFEDGLEDLVRRNAAAGRLSFTTDLRVAMEGAAAVFIAVGTPSQETGALSEAVAPDLSYVYAAARDIAAYLSGYCVIVNKSTMPVRGSELVLNEIKKHCPQADVDVVSNPEFLREGVAVSDFLAPDRVVVGATSSRAFAVLREIYKPLTDGGAAYLETTPATAEMIKYAANGFLATKVAFINEMANICEQVEANIEDLSHGIGLDHRIGAAFLKPGPGYGGSCFPKDTRALVHIAATNGAPTRIVEAVVAANSARVGDMVQKIDAAVGGLAHRRVAVWGLTFKANTDDVRDSMSLKLIPELLARGARVCAFDPQGMKAAQKILPAEVEYAVSAEACAMAADAVVILTEWPVFQGVDFAALKRKMTSPLIIDLRNILDPQTLAAQGFTCVSVGRPDVTPSASRKIMDKKSHVSV